MPEESIRDRINHAASISHRITRKAIGTDWYDTESQARRVAEFAAKLYQLLYNLTPIASEQIQRQRDDALADGYVGANLDNELAALHEAQTLIEELGGCV
jgi:hypothetical protein